MSTPLLSFHGPGNASVILNVPPQMPPTLRLNSFLSLLDLITDCLAFLRHVVGYDSGDLDNADDTEEEVDCSQTVNSISSNPASNIETACNVQDVSRLDNQAPSSPDSTSASKGNVLRQRELLSWTVEIGYTGENEAPLLSTIVSNCSSSCSCGV